MIAIAAGVATLAIIVALSTVELLRAYDETRFGSTLRRLRVASVVLLVVFGAFVAEQVHDFIS